MELSLSKMFSPRSISPLFTDLYELTMMAGYLKKNMNHKATFSVYLRPVTEKRGYFVFSGLKSILFYIENLKFSFEEISYLKSLNLFEKEFLDWLYNFKFSGDIYAMDEGTIFFGNEPVIEITAPIMEAQLLETIIVNTINLETMITTKAARCVDAAKKRPLIDFSLRRTHGSDAGLKVARSSYIAGFAGTSNLYAGKLFNIPVSGTMAHSFVTSFENEEDSFRSFADTFPDNCVLLIDTFDILEGAKKAAKIGKELEKKGKKLKGVRIDSGDMAKLSIDVREILDSNGLNDSKIFASGGFDEFKIEEVIKKGGKIDAFGVGTSMGVSADSPYHDTVYKLSRFNGKNVRKKSKNKTTLAGKKQVYRFFDNKGLMEKDIIAKRDEIFEKATPLLHSFIKNGEKVRKLKKIEKIKKRIDKNFKSLPKEYRALKDAKAFPVIISEELNLIQP